MKQLLFTVILNVIALLTNAQITIRPGDKIIRYDWIKSSHDFYRCVVSDTSGKVEYDFMMDDYTTVDKQKQSITFARQRQAPAGKFEADTSVTDLNLKPAGMHEVHSPQNVSFKMTFEDEQATVPTMRKGTPSTKKYTMKTGYFDDNMIEYIFGYLELKKGITYNLDNFNKDTPAPSDPFTLEYAFDDVWNISPDHLLYCTVLHFTHGGASGYIWIDKSTDLTIKTVANFKTGSYLLTKE
jgi:hypothetical protein